MTESAVDHEHPSSIAERFVDGFMHPGLEHDAERLAKGYMALEAQNDRLCELLQRIYDNERVWRVLPNSIAADMFAEMNVEILESNQDRTPDEFDPATEPEGDDAR